MKSLINLIFKERYVPQQVKKKEKHEGFRRRPAQGDKRAENSESKSREKDHIGKAGTPLPRAEHHALLNPRFNSPAGFCSRWLIRVIMAHTQ